MSQIEEVMYEALDLGITKEVFDEVKVLKEKEENRFVSLNDLYYLALMKSKMKNLNE